MARKDLAVGQSVSVLDGGERSFPSLDGRRHGLHARAIAQRVANAVDDEIDFRAGHREVRREAQ